MGTSQLIGGIVVLVETLTSSIWEDRECSMESTMFKLSFSLRFLHYLISAPPEEGTAQPFSFRNRLMDSQETHAGYGVYQSGLIAFARLSYSQRPEWLTAYAHLKSIAECQKLAADLIEEILTPAEAEDLYYCFQPEEQPKGEDSAMEEEEALFLQELDDDEILLMSQPANRARANEITVLD
ncbi:hypothetical protein BT69DRAFT_437796 [Atractiella rhizophila]|nr:hypothetical protein BT69DRAFT_437796 [Atractiella rhizophila]